MLTLSGCPPRIVAKPGSGSVVRPALDGSAVESGGSALCPAELPGQPCSGRWRLYLLAKSGSDVFEALRCILDLLAEPRYLGP